MKKGFSIVEIMVVLIIMSILTYVLVPNLLAYLERIKADKLELDIFAFRKEATLFFEKNGHWPGKLNDIMASGSGKLLSPWKTPYKVEGPFITVEVPKKSNVYMGSANAIEASNGKLKFLLKEIFVIAEYGNITHKIFPIKISSNSPYTNGADMMTQLTRPGSYPSYMLFYFTFSSIDNSMHAIMSVNKPGETGLISDYSLNKVSFDNINPVFVLYNSFYNTITKQIFKNTITNTYSGAVFTMDMEKSWNFKFNVENFLSSGDCYIGYLSGDIKNINKFGNSGGSDEYIGKEIEFAYFY
ncbi:MAG: prepilin-type N-terminal cleavage/methylation domain-containing protein [Candidatus Muirbacterium halophilum]|nr:prepilin-type N-terminal cleavage/methylation domain-containing protein [Candidatus Muirbacterium halophilum]MCK9476057.1 prepilin-type N-terminal cleavage/methylation domain-containing protein [Candidatus Muirbacterium halophilum]